MHCILGTMLHPEITTAVLTWVLTEPFVSVAYPHSLQQKHRAVFLWLAFFFPPLLTCPVWWPVSTPFLCLTSDICIYLLSALHALLFLMFFNLEVHECALNFFIHNIYLFLTDGAWVERNYVFKSRFGGGLITLSRTRLTFFWL